MNDPYEIVDYSKCPVIDCPICGSKKFSIVTTRFDSGRLVRCSDCSHTYLNPTLPNELLEAIYEKYYKDGDETQWMQTIEAWFQAPSGAYQKALELLGEERSLSGKKVLEIGCGPGRFLSECVRRGAMAEGVDLSPQSIKLAQKYFNLKILHGPFEYFYEKKSFPASSYDFIFIFEVIEHVRKPLEFLRLIHGLLKPDGVVYLSTPNFSSFYTMGKSAAVVTRWQEHLHFFDEKNLASLFQRAGMKSNIMDVELMSFSERYKQILVARPGVKKIWDVLRKNAVIYRMKDHFFQWLNGYGGIAGKKKSAGLGLLACGTKL